MASFILPWGKSDAEDEDGIEDLMNIRKAVASGRYILVIPLRSTLCS